MCVAELADDDLGDGVGERWRLPLGACPSACVVMRSPPTTHSPIPDPITHMPLLHPQRKEGRGVGGLAGCRRRACILPLLVSLTRSVSDA